MAGLVPSRASRLPSYSGRAWKRLPRLAAVLLLALAGSGCAVSSHLGSLFSKQDREEATAYADPAADALTGSIGARKAVAAAAPAAALPPESDLAYARAAVVEVLTRGSKDVSAPWENPRSGARGTVTPIATSYTQHGNVCRDFLASHVRERAETWMQGEACRPQKGEWEVRSLRPWTRS
jgi:surface antigen